MFETALEILNKIENQGYKAYIVGGYPRNKYLNLPTIDVDIATSATPKQLKEIFKNINLPKEQYGSVVIIKNKIRFEITTFRKEIKYKDNRYPVKVKYITDLKEDLLRRDFTINTLCINRKGELIDLLKSKEDLDYKIIKAVGNPRLKIKEDSLRILRAIRFATILDFDLDNNLKKYIKKYGSLLKKLSFTRKKQELNKIFTSPNALKGIKLILELKLDRYLNLKNLNDIKLTTSALGIWAQLEGIEKYPFSNHEIEIIKKIKTLINQDVLNNYNLYYYGLYNSTIAGEIKGIDRKKIIKKYNDLPIKSSKEIVLKPKEICHILETKPGPFLKEIKNDLEIKILNKEIVNKQSDLIKYVINKYKTLK